MTDTFPSEKESGVRLYLDVVPAFQQQEILVLFKRGPSCHFDLKCGKRIHMKAMLVCN